MCCQLSKHPFLQPGDGVVFIYLKGWSLQNKLAVRSHLKGYGCSYLLKLIWSPALVPGWISHKNGGVYHEYFYNSNCQLLLKTHGEQKVFIWVMTRFWYFLCNREWTLECEKQHRSWIPCTAFCSVHLLNTHSCWNRN